MSIRTLLQDNRFKGGVRTAGLLLALFVLVCIIIAAAGLIAAGLSWLISVVFTWVYGQGLTLFGPVSYEAAWNTLGPWIWLIVSVIGTVGYAIYLSEKTAETELDSVSQQIPKK